jgi:hypothetical protein
VITFQFRPLLVWGRPETDPRSSGARFRAAWTDTVTLLRREAELLGAPAIAIQVDTDETQIRLDNMLRSAARVGHPGVKLSFTSIHGPLTYATDQFDHWKANVRAIALGLQALRAVDRYGISKNGEQYTGWNAISDKPFAGERDLSVNEAVSTLMTLTGIDVTPDQLLSDPKMVAAAYRSAAVRFHPDRHGGDEKMFVRAAQARDVLLAALK